MIDTILEGDCLELLPSLPEDSIDAIVTDPPAGISFMSKNWDSDKGGRDQWIAWMSQVASECLRVIKPGGHALVWALPRTSHWTGMAWEEAGWEPRDKISHVFGSGFPKSLDISKKLDQMAGAEREIIGKRTSPYTPTGRNESPDYGKFDQPTNAKGYLEYPVTAPATPAAKQWAGWGSAIKPAHEDWWLFRKPLSESTITANVLRWGTGGLNIDGCRIDPIGYTNGGQNKSVAFGMNGLTDKQPRCNGLNGRFPANIIHDGSSEVLAEFAKAGDRPVAGRINRKPDKKGPFGESEYGSLDGKQNPQYFDHGSPARFFQSCPFTEEDIPAFIYQSKASRSERERGLDGMPISDKRSQYGDGLNSATKIRTEKQLIDGVDRGVIHNGHPTVKPLSLMRTLCRLITPPGGLILDPFAGSGTTCLAAKQEGFRFVGIEKESEYAEIARRRVASVDLIMHKPLTAFS